MRSVMASIPDDGEVQNTPNIHNATLFYIFLSTLKGYDSSALLWCYIWKPYRLIGKM